VGLKVYVAGASAERHTRARPAIQALRAAGVQVTHDWTFDPGFSAPRATRQMGRDAALRDLAGVGAADVLLFLSPRVPSRGAWVELGYALARGIDVVVAELCEDIFASLVEGHYPTDGAAIEAIISIARGRCIDD
jgi:nucleoside 2-deoxyribosyltransferase